MIFLDTDLAGAPPANACWIYPWYGEVCSDKAPTTTLARLTYGTARACATSCRAKQGFSARSSGAEWIDFREALSPVGYLVLRADFGISF